MPITAETCSQISPNCNYCILFDVCCVFTVHSILYRFDNTQRDGLSLKKKKTHDEFFESKHVAINIVDILVLLLC